MKKARFALAALLAGMIAGPAMASTLQVVDENGDIQIIDLENESPLPAREGEAGGAHSASSSTFSSYLVDSTLNIAPPPAPPSTPSGTSTGGGGCSSITYGGGRGRTTGYGRMVYGKIGPDSNPTTHFVPCNGYGDGNSH